MPNISIQLLDKTYEVSCSEAEVENLKAAARFLNDNLLYQSRDSGHSFSNMLLISALNACDLLLKSQSRGQESFVPSGSNIELEGLHARVREALHAEI